MIFDFSFMFNSSVVDQGSGIMRAIKFFFLAEKNLKSLFKIDGQYSVVQPQNKNFKITLEVNLVSRMVLNTYSIVRKNY